MFVRDAELPGFALRVTKGRKSFVLEKRVRGRMRRLTIGPYGPLTVDQARKLAATHVGAIAQGDDPAQVDRIGSMSQSLGISPSSISSGMRRANAPHAMIRGC